MQKEKDKDKVEWNLCPPDHLSTTFLSVLSKVPLPHLSILPSLSFSFLLMPIGIVVRSPSSSICFASCGPGPLSVMSISSSQPSAYPENQQFNLRRVSRNSFAIKLVREPEIAPVSPFLCAASLSLSPSLSPSPPPPSPPL